MMRRSDSALSGWHAGAAWGRGSADWDANRAACDELSARSESYPRPMMVVKPVLSRSAVTAHIHTSASTSIHDWWCQALTYKAGGPRSDPGQRSTQSPERPSVDRRQSARILGQLRIRLRASQVVELVSAGCFLVSDFGGHVCSHACMRTGQCGCTLGTAPRHHDHYQERPCPRATRTEIARSQCIGLCNATPAVIASETT
eukprot:39618-Rhodomonas_salina.2